MYCYRFVDLDEVRDIVFKRQTKSVNKINLCSNIFPFFFFEPIIHEYNIKFPNFFI